MRPVALLGRTCRRQPFRPGIPSPPCPTRTFAISRTIRQSHRRNHDDTGRRFRPSIPLAAGAVGGLSPLALVRLSEEKDGEKTGEQQMLAASRAEIDRQVPRILRHSQTIRVSIWRFLDTWIFEPVATGFRFLHLVVIFVPVIATIPVIWLGTRQKGRENERSGSLWWYGFLVRAMERAGAAFIKLGQWAASRSDIFPTELCQIMSELHSNAPAHSLARTKAIIERAFDGRPFEDIFDEFQEKPLGVGAIAQVYKAKLKPDLAVPGDVDVAASEKIGQKLYRTAEVALKNTPQRVPSSYVAIKVLHPNIERTVRRDLRIMAFFAAVINVVPTMEWLSFPDEVTQFSEMMRLQLDLRIEAANLTIFRKNFKDRTTAWFPYPYSDYTTRNVLIEEFATGIPLEAFLRNGGGVFQKEIADEGLDAFLHMVLIDNFIHADLHPGNIMVRFYKAEQLNVPRLNVRNKPHQQRKDVDNSLDVTEEVLERLRPLSKQKDKWAEQLRQIDAEGYRPQLIFIDTGLVTQLNAKNRRDFLDLFKALAEFDGYRAGHLMTERCRQPDAVVDSEVFALRMQHLVLGVKSKTFTLGNIKIGDVLSEVLGMVRTHHVRLEGDFVNVVLSILLLEGIGKNLDPNLDLFARALPILRQLGAQGRSLLFRGGDFSMLKVWVGLEARSLLQASVESVEACVKYDLLAPNV